MNAVSVFCLLCFVAPTISALGADDAPDSLDAVRAALAATPASVDNFEERCKILSALDGYLQQPDSERSDAVARYYQAMIEAALEDIANRQVAEGVVVWKLYSSSMVIKTPTVIFGIDLDHTPNTGSGGPDKVVGQDGIKLHMTPEQIARLAGLVDVSFHSHRHHDHVDYAITRALLDAGKTVVVPEDIRKMWGGEPFASKLTVLDPSPGNSHSIAGLTVEAFAGTQWMAADHSQACPCNAYLIETDSGVSVLFKGDINDGEGIMPWLQDVRARGKTVDLYVSSLLYWWGSDAMPDLQRMFDSFLIPGHEYEFTHRKPGEAGAGTGSYQSRCDQFRPDAARGKAVVLSWGEAFHYRPSLHREARTALVWLDLSPEPSEISVRAGDSFTVDFKAQAHGVNIERYYLAYSKTDAVRNLPGFDDRDWGGIIHDPDKDGVFTVSTEGWPPGIHILDCVVDDWPGGNQRRKARLSVTVDPGGEVD